MFVSTPSNAAIAGAHVERARDERDGEHHRRLRERDARVQEPGRPNAASSPMPGDGRRQDERQLDERDEERRGRGTAATPARTRSACPSSRIERLRGERRLQAHDERVGHDGVPELRDRACRAGRARRWRRPAVRGSASATNVASEDADSRDDAPHLLAPRKPAACSFACATGRSSFVDERPGRTPCACSTVTTATAYCDDRLRAPADPDRRDLAAHGPCVGHVDEAGVRLAERDLREHLAHVVLVAHDVLQTPSSRPRLCSTVRV